MKLSVKKYLSNRIVKNAGWIVGGKIAQLLINLVVGILTARYLGPANYGLINYVAAYTAFFSSICNLGINSILVKELIDSPEEEGEILGTSLVLQTISSILSAMAILAVVFIVDDGDPLVVQVAFLSLIGLIFRIFEVFNNWFQSRLQSKVTSLVTLFAYVVTASYKVALLVLGKSVVWFAFATALDYICVAVLLILSYRRYEGRRLCHSWEYGKLLLNKSKHFILPGLMVSLYSQTDKIMLKQMIDTAEVGYYATAVSICNMTCFVLAAIIDSVYPEIAKAHNQSKELFERRNRQLYAIIIYSSVAISVGLNLFGKLAIFILYGEAYLPAVAPLRILAWYTVFVYLGVARGAWVVCENKQRYLIIIYVSAALANVGLNALLIPALGTSGAALASLVAQAVTILVVPVCLREMRPNAKLMLEAICLKDVFPPKTHS